MEWLYWVLIIISSSLGVVVLSIRCRSRFWLGAYMAFVTGYLGLILLDAQSFYISPKLYFCLLPIVFLPGPLLLGYISHISTRNYVGIKDFAVCTLPWLILLAAPDLVSDKPLFANASQVDYQQASYISLFNLVSMMAGVQTLAYVAAAFYLMSTLKKDWASYQSKTLPRSWYQMMMAICVILTTTVTQISSAFAHPSGNAVSFGDIGFIVLVLYFIGMSLQTGWRNFKGYAQDEELILQSSEVPPVLSEASIDNEPLSNPAQLSPQAKAVKAQVIEQQLFLQEDLSLNGLAQQLDLTTHKLSELINSDFKQSFYEFINDLRVQYAAQSMLKKPGASITEIYTEAGFTSKSTFYGYFKKTFTCTPTEYRKQKLSETQNHSP